uniref:uncharacterized protein LOC100183672 n=1 Tax=Ciona intestinalis TaxID=7719 RepID=UPI0001B1E27C|nr:uncharacterized protein LOC100183672 [Ciona intestinalis]|eukprot:NP_001157732.1 uncharacterized protein LOC100183672 [Ciona intestinalis]
MADISRIASPMSLCEEDLFDVNKNVERQKKRLEELQKVRPASFLVGSIQKVNERICSLDNELSTYDSKLAIESRSSYNDEVYDPNTGQLQLKSVPRRGSRSARDREEKEERKFAGLFSSEFDGQPEGNTQRRKGPAKKSDAPRLVELQQYPGFVQNRHSPLPHGLEATVVIDHVISAQTDLKRKPTYQQEFRKMLYSRTQRAMLQDVFWWFFLDKYHPDKLSQSKLFRRISQIFVKLLLMSKDQKFRDKFFMNYASILAQSIYSAFCLAFPQSWRQFDEPTFKGNLLNIATMWVSGIQPPPRLYEKWNYSQLEPHKMRKEETMKVSKSGEKVDRKGTGKLSPIGSVTSTKTPTAHSRSGSNKGLLRALGTRSDAMSTVSSQKTKSNETTVTTDKGTLSPITEKPKTGEETKEKYSLKYLKENSCAIGRSVEFDRSVFNIHGRSPLLSEYLYQRGLHKVTGRDQLVRRTQIESLPSHQARTYNDLIQESSHNVRDTATAFNRIHLEGERASKEFLTKQVEENRLFKTKSSKLLSKPRQVRYLSNLVLMELKRDQDEVNVVGAVAAVQAALAAEPAN